MISLTWWEAILFLMMLYWPVTLMVTAAIVATAFMATRHKGWRIFWCAVAAAIASPVVLWFTV